MNDFDEKEKQTSAALDAAPPSATTAQAVDDAQNATAGAVAATAKAGTPRVSCDVCCDLMPLVLDGVASDDSADVVAVHTAGCSVCRALLEPGAATDGTVPNDVRILKLLSHKMAVQTGVVALAGVLGGAALMRFSGSVYLTWWLPLIGAIAYLVLRRRWWLAPALVGVLTTAGMVVNAVWHGWFDFYQGLVGPITLGLSWAVLATVGAGVGALLCFAFGRDEKKKQMEEQTDDNDAK